MAMNSQIITIEHKEITKSRKDTGLLQNLNSYLTKWQQHQNSEKAAATAQTILSQVGIKPKWQKLLIDGSFIISQVEKVIAADWSKSAESINYPESITAAIATTAPSIAVYRKYEDESATISVVSKMILFTLRMLNVQKSQDDFQVLMTAKMIVSDYYFLTFAEIKYCFVRGIHGDFGQLYAKVDAMDLLKWLKEYSEARSQFIEMEQERKSKKDKAELEKAKYNPEIFEMVRATLDKIEKKEQERKKQKQLSLLTARISFANRRVEQLTNYIKDGNLSDDEMEAVAESVKSEGRNLQTLQSEYEKIAAT